MSSNHPSRKNGPSADALKAQQATDRRWSALAQATGQIVWTTPADGLVTNLPYWRAFTGQSLAEVKGWGWLAAIHPDDRASAAAAWNHALARRVRYQTMYRVRRSDGVYRMMQATAIPLIEPDNETITEWVGTCNDITEQQLEQIEKQQLLQQSEVAAAVAEQQSNELTAIFNALSDGIIIYDQNAQIVRTNDAARRLYMLDETPGLESKHIYERVQHFELRDHIKQPLPQSVWPITRLLQGEILNGTDDYWIRIPDGSEREITISGTPIYTTDGEIIGAIAINRDITERRRLEKSAYASLQALLQMAEVLVEKYHDQLPIVHHLSELMTIVLDCPRIGIVAFEDDGRITPLVATGLPDNLRQQWFDNIASSKIMSVILHSPFRERLLAGEVIAIEANDPVFHPFRETLRHYRSYANITAPMLIGDTLIGVVSMDSDVKGFRFSEDSIRLLQGVARLAALTIERDHLLNEREESKAMVLALSESNRRMDDFLDIASHELRTPLTTIAANVQFADRTVNNLLTNYADDLMPTVYSTIQRLETMLKRANKQTRRMDLFIGDLLDISRIDAGKLTIQLERTNMVTIVDESVLEQQIAWSTRNITIDAKGITEAFVMVDAARLGQVLTNFLTNALKYSALESPVEICIEANSRQVTVEVTDKGPGIPVSEQIHIWERFHRVPGIESMSGSGVGLGLGLYISSTIILRLNGEIGVRSAEGEGSTFWFKLPIVS